MKSISIFEFIYLSRQHQRVINKQLEHDTVNKQNKTKTKN